MDNPRRCKIIKCGLIAVQASQVVVDLAIADSSLLTNPEADALIESLENLAAKVAEDTPSPPIT